MRAIIVSAFESPTFTTWAAHSAKATQHVVALALAYVYLPVEYITIWLIFQTLISLQVLADIGLTPTFTRALSISLSGQDNTDRENQPSMIFFGIRSSINFTRDISFVMRNIYLRLSLWSFLGFSVLGTLVLYKPISALDESYITWIAWAILLTSLIITFYGNCYVSYLQASEKIPTLQKWRIICSIGAATSIAAALIIGAGLLGAVISQQFWSLVQFFFNRKNSLRNGYSPSIKISNNSSLKIRQYIWPATIRSGIGILLGYCVVQISGLIYTQVSTPAESAKYLLILRLLSYLSQYSQAPFYTKLPKLSKLYATNNLLLLRKLAFRGIIFSVSIYLLGATSISTGIYLYSDLFNIGTELPDIDIWLAFTVGGLVERYGSMHIQLYSLSNHIIWHIANGISGIIFILLSILLVPSLSLKGFALAYLLSNTTYALYATKHSYRLLKTGVFQFDGQIFYCSVLILVGLYLIASTGI